MTLEAQCDIKYSKIVRLRAHGRCEMTGLEGVHAHHIKFRSQCTLEEYYDTMLGIYLAAEVHIDGEGAPHGLKADPKGFINTIIKIFRASQRPELIERADYIECMRDAPKKSPIKNQPKIVTLSIINMKLSEELREAETAWMDPDEPEHGRKR